jgi:hypothetical protein
VAITPRLLGGDLNYTTEIYYAKIRYNGIMDVPYRSVTNMSDPEHFHGEVDLAARSSLPEMISA